jgi:hypothetical protein
MATVLATAIKEVKAKCLTIPGIQYAAVFNNQVKMEQGGATFDFPKPAILIEISAPTVGVVGLGGYASVNEFEWRLSIVYEQLNAEYDGNSGTGMDENFDVFAVRDLVKQYMSGFSPYQCSQFIYKEESPDYNHNMVYVYGISFICSYVDTNGSPADGWIYNTPPINLDLEVELPSGTITDTFGGFTWKVGKIVAYIVDAPNPALTQTLTNGAIIPLQYAVNNDAYDQWASGNSYVVGDKVNIAVQGYECTIDNSDVDFDPANWTEIAPQYATLTIPYLASNEGIEMLTPLMINNDEFDNVTYIRETNKIDISIYGGFHNSYIEFNASIPNGL